MEFWIDDERYEIVLGPTLTGDSVTTLFSKTLKEGNGFLSVLQIYAGDSVLELLFDSTTRSPVRLALGFPNLALEPLLEMFSTFHKNDVIMCGKRKLKAKPDKGKSATAGKVDLAYSNPSISSLTLRVDRLYSRNSQVASATPGAAPPISIQVSGRVPKWPIPIPFRDSRIIGSWAAINLGHASLVADVLIYDEFDQFLYAETISDDVQVI